MSKIAVAAFVTVTTMAIITMVAASSWGADNLPHDVHTLAWHLVAMR